MSQVTNALLTFSVLENEEQRVAEVNEALAKVNNSSLPQEFLDATDPATTRYGGYKVFECPLYMAAFNHIATNDLLASVKAASWAYSGVQLLVNEQDDDAGFRVLTLDSVPA